MTKDLPIAFFAPPRSSMAINLSVVILIYDSSSSEEIIESFSEDCLCIYDVIYPAILFLNILDLTIDMLPMAFLLSSKSVPNLS